MNDPHPALPARAVAAPPPVSPDPDTRARAAAERCDAALQAGAARLTAGLSPVALALAQADWALHLATQPAQALRLGLRAQQQAITAAASVLAGEPPRDDPRFGHPGWRHWPWSALAHGQQAAEDWWAEATTLRGMSRHHHEMVRFFASRWLDALAPSNLPALNPEVLERTVARSGANLADGALNAVDGWRQAHGLAPLRDGAPRWRPGIEVATTPGKVVHRNHLVELIQYLPATTKVQREPVLIVPSWIMKYYILDLSPHNSMVRWLVSQGHTVFMLSWRNPDESDALLAMQDYLDLGLFDPLAAIARLLPGTPVHACGYCLGGTLLALAAAALAQPGRPALVPPPAPLASVTLLAAETDFSEPGELGLLIDEGQVALLENIMAERGFLTGRQMADSFTFLHARELYWAHRLRAWWLGEASDPNDLMAWNADVTRMPAAMHSEYLRRCYLGNEIAEGRFPVHGRPVSLADIEVPLFVVGTEKDHVSPWRSVHKIHRLARTELTFVLTNGGHNAGIVSEPGHAGRRHALATRPAGRPAPDPDAWQQAAERREGSWWPSWHAWLLAHGSGRTAKARTPAPAAVLGDAPGQYVQVRYND